MVWCGWDEAVGRLFWGVRRKKQNERELGGDYFIKSIYLISEA